MAKRKTPEQVIAESNARIAAARLRIAREKSENVRRLERAQAGLDLLDDALGLETVAICDARADIDEMLVVEIAKANGDKSANAAPPEGVKP